MSSSSTPPRRRRQALAHLIVAAALLLSACGGSDNASASGRATDSAQSAVGDGGSENGQSNSNGEPESPDGSSASAQPDAGRGGAVSPPDTVPRTAADSMRRGLFPRVATPDTIRGLYVNRWAAIGNRMWQLADLARRTEVNALVIDVKDDRGLMLYRSEVPLAREIGADTVQPMSDRRLAALMDTLRRHNIYPIARIVVVKDPLLAEHREEWAIRRRDDTTRAWLDRSGKPWLDPHQPGVWTYAIDIAREAVRLGFAEVQLDYVRFPDERRMAAETTYPLSAGRRRAQVIREMLGGTRDSLRSLGVPITADVFGLTGTDTTDMGIGQHWESFIDQVDVVLPMMYPSHYAPGTYGLSNPNANPYATIDRGLKDMIARTRGIQGAARVIPWYQDFTLGSPRYGAEQVRAQIQAGYDNGFPDWILWNPGSRYTASALRPVGGTSAARSSAEGDTSGVGTAPDAADSLTTPPDSTAAGQEPGAQPPPNDTSDHRSRPSR